MPQWYMNWWTDWGVTIDDGLLCLSGTSRNKWRSEYGFDNKLLTVFLIFCVVGNVCHFCLSHLFVCNLVYVTLLVIMILWYYVWWFCVKTPDLHPTLTWCLLICIRPYGGAWSNEGIWVLRWGECRDVGVLLQRSQDLLLSAAHRGQCCHLSLPLIGWDWALSGQCPLGEGAAGRSRGQQK